MRKHTHMQTPPTRTHIPTDMHTYTQKVTPPSQTHPGKQEKVTDVSRTPDLLLWHLDPPYLGREMDTSCQEVEFSPSVSPAVDIPCPTILMLCVRSGGCVTWAHTQLQQGMTPATSLDAEPAALPSARPR